MADGKRHVCAYCKYWIRSPVFKKDGSGKKSNKRKCITRGKLIDQHSSACKYFDPDNIVWCDNYHQRSEMILCLQRRRNPKDLKAHSQCRKCRQFDIDIQDILTDYYFGNKTIISPDVKIKGRKLRRRADHPKVRKITRRSKPKRTITRRKKKRTIKRR